MNTVAPIAAFRGVPIAAAHPRTRLPPEMLMLHRLARRVALVATPVLFAVAGCADSHGVTGPTQLAPPTSARTDASSPLWAQIVDGETGPGSVYRLYMPKVWNGKLVVYAHGIIAPFL